MATQDAQHRPFVPRSRPTDEWREPAANRATGPGITPVINWPTAPTGWTEAERIDVLGTYRILDADPEPAFDDMVRMASQVIGVPIAAVNLISSDRHWSMAEIGLGTREMSRELSICSRAILLAGGLTVEDMSQDPRLREHELVTGAAHLRFYASELVMSREGLPLGTFCVADNVPRPGGLSDGHRFFLKTLAGLVGHQLDLRRKVIACNETIAKQAEGLAAQRTDGMFLRGVLAASEDCIQVLDLDGNVVFISDGGARALQMADKSSIAGRSWTGFWKGEGLQKMQSAIATACAGSSGRFQATADTMGGQPRDWDVLVTPIFGGDGRPERLLSVSRDITAMRRAEEALREAQGLNTLILHSSQDCIIVLDLYGHIQFVSAGGIAAMEIADVESIIGGSWLRAWTGNDRDLACAAVAEARTGRSGRFVGFCPTHTGTPKWWDVVVSPLPGPDGAPERLVTVGRDVTAHRQAELRLARSEERLSLALAASGMVGIWEWDLNNHLVYANANVARIYGIDPERALSGAPRAEYIRNIHPDDTAAFQAQFENALAGSGDVSAEVRILQSDQTVLWVLARGRLIRDGAGVAIRLAGTSVDITDRKHSQHRLDRLQAANGALEQRVAAALAERETIEEVLRQSQKMEAVGQLTGGLAHDFNNLLASISGSLEILDTRLSKGMVADFQRYIEAAQGAARRAAALTHRLLAFSRRQTLDPRPTDVNVLVDGMQELIRRTAGPEITLEVMRDERLWNTLVDANQLENALLNLCINARDAMPNGGRLTVSTANAWLDEKDMREDELPPGPYVRLCVTDTGSGMTPEIIRRVFDPFFTTKPLGMGTGLGLSMVYGFVRQSGGQVGIESGPGQGTQLSLHLPRHLGQPEGSEPADGPGGATHSPAGETVLLVDDEPTLRMLIAELLEERGYHVIEAGDGASGLKVLQSDAWVDLLVTDVGLPGGMNGRQLADAARQLRSGLKVLFITGFAESVAKGGGELEPGMQVLTKPFALEALATCVREMVTGER